MTHRSQPATRNATYKGRTYSVRWSGTTKTGKQMAKLAFIDGSKEFWVDVDKIALESQCGAEDRRTLAAARKAVRNGADYYTSDLYDEES